MSANTKPVQFSDLFGPALDWAVGFIHEPEHTRSQIVNLPCLVEDKRYSSDWSLAGPIVEREDISIIRLDDESIPDDKGFCCGKYEPRWAAVIGHRHFTESDYGSQGDYWGLYYKIASSAVIGSTPLIAAMRCYVASRLGATVEIPEELL